MLCSIPHVTFGSFSNGGIWNRRSCCALRLFGFVSASLLRMLDDTGPVL